MSLITFPQDFLSSNEPVVDKSGQFTRNVRYLLLALFNRTGQGSGAPIVQTELVVAAGGDFNITADWNQFSTVAGAGACLLPPMAVGSDCIIFNDGVNSLNVKAQAGVGFDALAVGTPYSLAAGKMQWFRSLTPTSIRSMQLG